MKFMKLGSKPDTFQTDVNSVRYVSSELATDVIINLGQMKYCLHKFPLLSKSNYLQKLVQKADEENSDEICITSFPGGAKAFEICAKFCYGMTVTLNAYNVVAARCAAEYLEMTEDMDRGNLIFKIEVFLNSSIFRSWKDSILFLQATKTLQPWSEDLKIVGRCIDSIASKTSVDPADVSWSYTYNRKLALAAYEVMENGTRLEKKIESVPKDWWVEDICELEIDIYKRVIVAVKSKGRMNGDVIEEALKSYAVRWLPDTCNALVSEDHKWRNKTLLETLICLLPSDKVVGCSCSFLLKLLKVAILVGADDSAREDLVNRISFKLDHVSVKDLLIPARPPQSTTYDVDLVHCILNRFVAHKKQSRNLENVDKNEETGDLFLGCGSLLNVGNLIDDYLAEIACDPNLALSNFIELSQLISESERPIHDGIYRAIDIYLKVHPSLTKPERKKICGLINVKKLSTDASMHAAQNERLPLRMVVQVLFFVQIRAAASASLPLSNSHRDVSLSTTNTDEECEKTMLEKSKSLNNQMSRMKIKDEEFRKTGKLIKKNSKRGSGVQLLPSRSRRMFDKLWAVGKGHVENRSSETSGSSQSPTSLIPAETKSSASSSRHRRHSIS